MSKKYIIEEAMGNFGVEIASFDKNSKEEAEEFYSDYLNKYAQNLMESDEDIDEEEAYELASSYVMFVEKEIKK